MERTRTVLVVDDEPAILEVVSLALADEGYRVWQARDGAAALALALAAPPDVVVANVSMPRLSGVELAAELRKRGLPTPVVLMSANHEIHDGPGLLFVSKPFDLDHVLTVVERALQLP